MNQQPLPPPPPGVDIRQLSARCLDLASQLDNLGNVSAQLAEAETKRKRATEHLAAINQEIAEKKRDYDEYEHMRRSESGSFERQCREHQAQLDAMKVEMDRETAALNALKAEKEKLQADLRKLLGV
jgi:septal ring factor EnvC (AmiA/AmiB activator)